MTQEEIISKVKELNLPKGSYVVFGSCPMTIAGIREAGDIDMLVSKEVFDDLRTKGWKVVDKGREDKPLTYDYFEAHDNWNFSSYNPTLEQLLEKATYIEEVPFASLEDVLKWKKASSREKDLKDIELIQKHLESTENN